jgi:hypothetical protein
MNAHNPFEDSATYSTRHEAHKLVELALRGEHAEIPPHLKGDGDFKSALGEKIASLLYRELIETSLQLMGNMEVPSDVVHSDVVHSAALRELSHLEESFVENLPEIRRLMEVFDLTEEDVPEELREILKKDNLPYRRAA